MDAAAGADVLVVPMSGKDDGLSGRLSRLGGGVAEAVERALELGDFEANSGRPLLVHSTRGDARFPRVLLIGLGGDDSEGEPRIRRAFSGITKGALPKHVKSAAVLCSGALGTGNALASAVASAVDGLLEGAYRWTASSTPPEGPLPARFLFLGDTSRDRERIEEGLRTGRRIGEAVSLAREVANTPANLMGPQDLASRARAIGEEKGLTVMILEGSDLERERCHGLRAVGESSSRPPCLITLEHAPRGVLRIPPIALVGKGLVFDTGGLNIKPEASMADMKFDKCGACAVLGAMSAIASLELPVRVVAVIPAAENSISDRAYRPGDVIPTRSGKTIEIFSTDAEGRVVLADALDYVITTYTPRAIVDIATLTGSVYYALGDRACAILGNHEPTLQHLRAAGERVGERTWPLPLWEEYLEDVKTWGADVRNTGTFGAGAIAGAAFLKAFVRDVPWAHLDIASVARDRRDNRVGATGFGVRLLVEAVRTWPKAKRVA